MDEHIDGGSVTQFPCDTIMTKPHTTVLDKDSAVETESDTSQE